MKLHKASDILDKVEFNNQTDWMTYPTTTYSCSNCNEKVSINFSDLSKHSLSSATNLSEKDDLLINDFVNLSELNSRSYLDFYCPNCKKPVRIYYSSWAGGHHTEAGYLINYIVD